MWYAMNINYGIHARTKTLREIRLNLGVGFIDRRGLTRMGKGRYEYDGRFCIYDSEENARRAGWGWAFAINRIPPRERWIKLREKNIKG